MALDFTFTDEHEELRATLRAFLEQRSDEQAVRAQMESERGHDPGDGVQRDDRLDAGRDGLGAQLLGQGHGKGPAVAQGVRYQ